MCNPQRCDFVLWSSTCGLCSPPYHPRTYRHVQTPKCDFKLTSCAFTCVWNQLSKRGQHVKAHEEEAYCDIHCYYVISTPVVFFESKLKTQCVKTDVSSNMENEQNVINTKSLLLTNMPFSGAASTYHSCGDWSKHNQSCCENSISY